MKKELLIFVMLIMLAVMLTLTSCAIDTKKANDIPCEALELIFYEKIEPIDAELAVLKNNAVIDEVCK